MGFFEKKADKWEGAINGKKVIIDTLRYHYLQSAYKKDYDEVIKLHLGQMWNVDRKKIEELAAKLVAHDPEVEWLRPHIADPDLGQKHLEPQILQFFEIKRGAWISKENQSKNLVYFKFYQIAEKFLTEAIGRVLHRNPQFITSGKFCIQIKIERAPNFSWYTIFHDEIATSKDSFFTFSASWLLNSICLPFFYADQSSPKVLENAMKTLEKFFQDKFTNQYDIINKRFTRENLLKKKFAPHMEKTDNYSLFYLHLAFENLRVKGLGAFKAMELFQSKEFTLKNKAQEIKLKYSMEINKEWLVDYQKNVRALAGLRASEAKTEKFYEDNLDTGTTKAYLTGIEYVGKVMCYTIALYEAMQKNEAEKIFVVGKHHYFTGKNIGKALASHEDTILYCQKLPEHIFNEAFALISRTHFQDFIRLYEMACDSLKIEEKHRAVTWKFYEEVAQEAKQIWEKEFAKKVKSEGFEPNLFS